MTSTKTYYFTTVLRTIFTERKIIGDGKGDQPSFDDIANFEDYWDVRKVYVILLYILIRISRLRMKLFLMVYLLKNGIMIKI